MNFHFIADTQMAVISTPFNQPLPKLRLGDNNDLRPSYVTIDKEELEDNSHMTEQQMVSYLDTVRRKLTFGGKVYLEVANYS